MAEHTSFITPYSNAEAERGKFVVVDQDYLETTYDYPSGGRGRYAVLTKSIDPIEIGSIGTDSGSTDAFGRLRVSEPYSLFGSKLTIGKNPEYWDEITNGTSTSVHVSADAMVTLSVSASSDYAIRQTRQRFIYQPGKSQYSLITFVSAHIETNVYKRIGLFYGDFSPPYDSTYDGIYFESNGVTNNYCFCIGKTQGTNQGVQSVPQSAWNVDPLDGTGRSGIALNFTKNQILYIDYEWLGVGRVRLGFVVNGKFYIAHEFNHANLTQGVYITSPNLPVRYEIRGAGSNTASGNLGQICASVMSEGGFDPTGAIYSVSRSVTSIGTFSTSNFPAGSIAPVISLRLKDNYVGDSVSLLSFDVISDSAMGGVYQLMVLRNASYSTDDGTWISLPNTGVEYKANSTIASRITAEGTIINSHYFTAPNSIVPYQRDVVEDVVALGTSINGTRDRIDLAIRKISGNDNAGLYGSLTFRELR